MSIDSTSSHHHVDSVSSLYKELKECISEVEQMEETRVSCNNSSGKKKELTKKQEEEMVSTTILEGYFIQSNANCK